MKIIYGIGRVKPALTNTVAAIGIFDGVHKGHQSLIRRMVASAHRKGVQSLVITFHPHPVEVLHQKKLTYLVSLSQRIELIKALGVDIVLVIKFTQKFARLKPEEFVKKYLVKRLGVKEVFVGDDFRFGENRSGNVNLFEEMGVKYGFLVNHMNTIKKTAGKISSTWLRDLIEKGRLSDAHSMLGRNVSVEGKVIRGSGRGKRLGFPTANIKLNSGILPPRGVYIVRVQFNGCVLNGISNIGCRPSFTHKNLDIHFEVHIFDFQKNIYSQSLSVEFLKKIRNEKKFPSLNQLAAQIRSDETTARRFLRSQKN
jgi:riboflavin kinase/FMN adenylyltransferase